MRLGLDLQCYCLLPKYLVLVLDWKSTWCTWCHPSTVCTCTCICKFEKYLYLTQVLPKVLDPNPCLSLYVNDVSHSAWILNGLPVSIFIVKTLIIVKWMPTNDYIFWDSTYIQVPTIKSLNWVYTEDRCLLDQLCFPGTPAFDNKIIWCCIFSLWSGVSL